MRLCVLSVPCPKGFADELFACGQRFAVPASDRWHYIACRTGNRARAGDQPAIEPKRTLGSFTAAVDVTPPRHGSCGASVIDFPAMVPNGNPSNSEREQTDKSLRVEREKADDALGGELSVLDETADTVLSKARD